MSILFIVYHFISEPTRLWHGLCLSNCPTHKGKIYLFSQIHTHKTKTKRTIKIFKTRKIVLKTLKEREKENHQEKIEINNILKKLHKKIIIKILKF